MTTHAPTIDFAGSTVGGPISANQSRGEAAAGGHNLLSFGKLHSGQ